MTPANHPDPRRVRLLSDGVVASYIHDISARTAPVTERRHGGQLHGRASRLAHTRAALRGRDADNAAARQ